MANEERVIVAGAGPVGMVAAMRLADQGIPVLIISGVVQAGEFDFRSYVPDESVPPPEAYLEKPINVPEFLQVVEHLTETGTPRSETSDFHV